MGSGRERERERSREACPECGAHRLGVVDFPDLPTVGYHPYSELLGMGEPRPTAAPGIGCLECGAEWRDLESFRAGDPPLMPEPGATPAHGVDPRSGPGAPER